VPELYPLELLPLVEFLLPEPLLYEPELRPLDELLPELEPLLYPLEFLPEVDPLLYPLELLPEVDPLL
jgi:hypothetical protein